MKILITGSNGFIGKNLSLFLSNNGHEILGIDVDNITSLDDFVSQADFIIHLAGVNRPLKIEEFYDGNLNFTVKVVECIKKHHKENTPFIYSSSIQALLDNDYGKSKLMAEKYLLTCGLTRVYIYRLSNVFGKWCRPNYNSAVSTFIYNIIRDLPIQITNPENIIHLVYIDDICKEFNDVVSTKKQLKNNSINEVLPIYQKNIREIIDTIISFKESRKNLLLPDCLDEFKKKLYSTYLSYLPIDDFSYSITSHVDQRGSFTELFKTLSNGQVSVNIIKPGITKGNHYHNSKNEKFIVVKGECEIKFRKVYDNEVISYQVSDKKFVIVDIPTGFTHNITNIGNEESVVIMWANEKFDKDNPDTYFLEV